MMIKAVRRCQLSPRPIIYEYRCAEFGSLHNGLDFAMISYPLANFLREQKINGAFLVAIAAFKEGILIKEGT